MKNDLSVRILALLPVLLIFGSCKFIRKIVNRDQPANKTSFRYDKDLTKKVGSARTLEIEKLDIGAIDGLPAIIGDSLGTNYVAFEALELNLDSIDPRQVHVDNNGRLSIRFAHVDELELDPKHGPRKNGVPYRLPQLQFKEVTVKYKGAVVKRFKTYSQARFDIRTHSLTPADPAKAGADDLMNRVYDLEARIKKLHQQISDILKVQPDDAVQQFTAVLNEIEIECAKIKERYLGRLPKLESLSGDLGKLFSFDQTVTSMEEEVDNPDHTVTLGTSVLFRSGEYRLTLPQQRRQLDVEAKKIVRELSQEKKLYPNRQINLALVVTGYADDREISGELRTDLYNKYPNLTPKGDEQDHLNRFLSEERAKTVINYLQVKFDQAFGAGTVVFLSKPVGKGRTEYPAGVLPGSCPGDCQSRRVVVISAAEFPRG